MDDVLNVSVENQSQHAFWNDPTISNALVFVTADFVWGNEAHYDEHRYIVSPYIWKHSSLSGRSSYYLEDRYMTVQKYGEEADIPTSEREEILARLRRIKAETKERP